MTVGSDPPKPRETPLPMVQQRAEHDRTHAHMIQADPSGRFVLHADLGLDRIFVWKFDERAGVLNPNDPPSVALPPEDGPRHFFFHPNGRWLYSLQEEGSNIVLFDYDAANGALTSRQTISSLPPGFTGSNFCSEILVSVDEGLRCSAILVKAGRRHLLLELADRGFGLGDPRLERVDPLLPRLQLARFLARVRVDALLLRVRL